MFMLVSCSSNTPAPQSREKDSFNTLTLIASSKTQAPTESPTIQSTLTPTDFPTSTPLVVIPPYQTKQVILKYTRSGGGLGSPESVFDRFLGYATTKFVLYADNQLIFQDYLKPIQTKILTKNEKEQLLSLLDKTGFYSIETNSDSDTTNPIYDFRGKYDLVKITDGIDSCLSANVTISKQVCFYEPYKDFLIPKMKELFQFIYNYTPSKLTVYQPDRLLVYVSKGRDFYDSFTVKSTKIIPWPSDLASLETSQEKYMYIEGKSAMKILSLFDARSQFGVFSEDGQDYSVIVTVVFPDETLTEQ